MTDQHPITPPPNLRRLWAQEAQRISPHDPVEWMQYVSEKAAQWGADTELEACCEWLIAWDTCEGEKLASFLREGRRPKPPSLKEQAYAALDAYIYGNPDHNDKQNTYNTIRRALEALPDD